jgi:hypothetical protein
MLSLSNDYFISEKNLVILLNTVIGRRLYQCRSLSNWAGVFPK